MKHIFSSFRLAIFFILLMHGSYAWASYTSGMYFLYHDDAMIDLKIYKSTSGTPCAGKCTLTKNGTSVKTWTNESAAELYYSDPDGATATWILTEWDLVDGKYELSLGQPAQVSNTNSNADGTLHNEPEWLIKLGRGRVDWKNGREINVDNVKIKGGITLEEAKINLVNDGSYLHFYDDLEIIDSTLIKNVSGSPSSGDHTSVILSDIDGAANNPSDGVRILDALTLEGKIKFQIIDSSNIIFQELLFTPGFLDDYIEFLNYAIVEVGTSSNNNSFINCDIPYLSIKGDYNSFESGWFGCSKANYVHILGDNNIVKYSKITGQIEVYGKYNSIVDNRITMQVVSDHGFDLDLGEAISLAGQENYVRKNRIRSGYPADQEDAIQVIGSEHRVNENRIGTVKAAGDGYKSGIHLNGADKVEVCCNTIFGMSYAGIRLTDSTHTSHLQCNSIQDVKHGIEIQSSVNNEIGPRNVIVRASNYGLYLYSVSDETTHSNSFYENCLIDTFYGIGLDCIAGACSNNDPKVSLNSFLYNRLNNRGIVGNKWCSPVQLDESVADTKFYGNYIISGCDIGRDLGRDLGVRNEFFDNIDGGNYWDNYTGTDGDDIDTFGDTPYDIYGNAGNVTNQDELPLVFHTTSTEITPESIDFGSLELFEGTAVDIGESRVIIKNTGTKWPLFIYKMYFSGTDGDLFTCGNSCRAPIKLEPGQQHKVILTYSPDKVDSHSADFNIVHSTDGLSHTRISLSGKGQDKEGDITGIRGQVTDGVAGIADVRVNAYTPGDTTTPVRTAVSNFSGNYILTGLSAGDYVVEYDASNTGFVSQWYDDKAISASADSVAVTSAQLTPDIDAALTLQTFTVTPAVTGGSGTILPDANQTANYGARVSFTLTPGNNHTIRRVDGTCGGFLNNTTFTTHGITGDCTVNAVFASDAVHNVTPSVSGGNGTIAPDTVQAVNDQTTAQFTLTPADGYCIDQVTGTCGGTLQDTKYMTSAVTADCTVIAHFAIENQQYTITVSANPSAGGTVTGGGTYNENEQVTVEATANANYSFVNWTEGGQVVSANQEYTFNAENDRTLVANFQLNQYIPTVTTTTVSAITSNSATSGGNVTSDGGAAVTARGVCWSTSANPTTANSKTTDGTGTGSFTSFITGLNPGTEYHVRAYATNSVGSAYGEDQTFTTTPATAIPTVATTAVSSITSNSASSGGNVTNDGGAAVTARGVCWSTSANPTTSDSHTSDGTGTGSFTSSITGLSPNTTYHVRAYATNSEGTGYGSDQTFTTTPTTATKDELAIDFKTTGIYVYNTGSWNRIYKGVDPEGLCSFGTYLAADFGTAYGLYVYDAGAWTRAYKGVAIEKMAGFGDKLAVDFGTSYSIYEYNFATDTWTSIYNYSSPRDKIEALGDKLVVDFKTVGIYIYDAGIWNRIYKGVDPVNIVSFGDKLAIDFGTAYGLYVYEYDTDNWTRVYKGVAIEKMSEIDGDLAVDFGTAYGLYVYEFDTDNWTRVYKGVAIEKMAGFDGKLAVDFGTTYPIYEYDFDTDNWNSIYQYSSPRDELVPANILD